MSKGMNIEEAIKYLNIYKNILKNNNTQTAQAIETVLNLTQEQQAEMEKKDKIIDEMAKSISKDNELNFEVCENVYKYNIECIEKDKTKEMCKDCIKQYFERKVEEC